MNENIQRIRDEFKVKLDREPDDLEILTMIQHIMGEKDFKQAVSNFFNGKDKQAC